MKSMSIGSKYRICKDYLKVKEDSPLARVAVTNYVNALKRAGLIKEDQG